jgi:uncharacterized ferredoxin-like protein
MNMILNPESDVLETLAKSILLAARTAPKAKGIDDIVTALVEKDDIEILASAMEKLGEEKGEGFISPFKRDAANLRKAGAAVLIGVKTSGAAGFNCRACGFETCTEMLNRQKAEAEFKGPNCMFKYADLGVAIGAATAKAKDFCLDNRVMYTVGAAARISGLLDADVVFGIPLSVTGKNIFFDRK